MLRAVAILAVLATLLAAPAAPALVPRDLLAPGETAADVEAAGFADRFVPAAAGTKRDMTFALGPFVVPPGHDLNRVSVDLPTTNGFVTRVLARAVDVATGAEPSNMAFHIHHFLWYKPAGPGEDTDLVPFHRYLFASGEERTRLDLESVADADPAGPRYGLFVEQGAPHTLVYMLHNKLPQNANVLVLLDVTFVDGSAAEIAAAGAGEYRDLSNRLWGSIFDVPRNAAGETYVHGASASSQVVTASRATTLVSLTGHVHPGGREIVIANLGPASAPCADLDGDGFAGVTIFRSRKVDRVAAAAPWSEDFQMETTQAAWRAPVRAGDRIAQLAVYANRDHASYNAMSITALHADDAQAPPMRAGGCTLENTRAALVGGVSGDPVVGRLSRAWQGDAMPLCGDGLGSACDVSWDVPEGGIETDVVQIADFTYVPGGRGLFGPLGAPPKVRAGESLRFVNEEAGVLTRHTVTSCPWPCDGAYRANYPLPDGAFDSGRLGNMDPLDQGGPWTVEGRPVWSTPVDLARGVYSYYCRLHPTMRGTFEVV